MPRLWGRRHRKALIHFLFPIVRLSEHRGIVLQLQWRFFLSELTRSRVLWEVFLQRSDRNQRGSAMSIWILIGIVAAWFILQAFILPKLGIST